MLTIHIKFNIYYCWWASHMRYIYCVCQCVCRQALENGRESEGKEEKKRRGEEAKRIRGERKREV